MLSSSPPPQSGKKLADQHENPLDLLLINLCERWNPTFRAWGVTPNLLTTASLFITCVGLALHYFVGWTTLGGLLYFVGYFFDCADGNFARRYGLTTKFGDYYDHVADILKFVLGVAVLLHIPIAAAHRRTARGILVILIVLLLLSLVPIGCQERASAIQSPPTTTTRDDNGDDENDENDDDDDDDDDDDSETLRTLKRICRSPSWIRVTRFFGMGTLQLGLTLALIGLPFMSPRRR